MTCAADATVHAGCSIEPLVARCPATSVAPASRRRPDHKAVKKLFIDFNAPCDDGAVRGWLGGGRRRQVAA